jgi:hypothetical protein
MAEVSSGESVRALSRSEFIGELDFPLMGRLRSKKTGSEEPA